MGQSRLGNTNNLPQTHGRNKGTEEGKGEDDTKVAEEVLLHDRQRFR